MHIKKLLQLAILVILATGCVSYTYQSDEVYYTTMNMWQTRDAISSVNYSVDRIIPVNSRVYITSISSKKITFYLEGASSIPITYVNNEGYSGLPSQLLFEKYFSPTQVDLTVFSEVENDFIKNFDGYYQKGISKEALLVARGLPPIHRTPSIALDSWVYWRNKWKKRVLDFRDGELYKVNGELLE